MTQPNHHIQTLFAGDVTEADLRRLAELHCVAFPKRGRRPEGVMNRWRARWVDYDPPESFHPRLFIVREGGEATHNERSASGETQTTAPAPQHPTHDSRIIAMSEVAQRQIEVVGGEGGQTGTWWTVMTLAQVASAPDRRGLGLGQAVVRASLDVVDRGALPMALFQTTHAVRPFYEKIGACLVEHNTFINSQADDPNASPWWNDVVMRYPAHAPWPAGRIDLHGPAW